MKIVGGIFDKMKIVHFFLCELPLILGVDRKEKNEIKIFAGGPQISNVNEIGQFVQALFQATNRKLKINFLVSGIFLGKADSVILLGFECTITPQNLIKIILADFDKIKILIFFSCELPLILVVGGKLKKWLEIFTRGPQISNFNDIGQLVQALRSATDRHRHTHTHTHTHIYTHTHMFL